MTNASLKKLFRSKKFLLLLCLIVIIVFIIILFSSQGKSPETVIKTHLLTPTAKLSIVTTPSPSPTDDTPGKWNTLNKPTYSMQYPPDWSIQEFSLAKQGTITTFKPAVLPNSAEYPSFILQVQNETEKTMQNTEGVLVGLGLKESTYKLGNKDVLKFSGTIPFATENGQNVNKPVQDTTLFIRQGPVVYILKYEYEGAEQDSSLEDFFQGFTLSFKLK